MHDETGERPGEREIDGVEFCRARSEAVELEEVGRQLACAGNRGADVAREAFDKRTDDGRRERRSLCLSASRQNQKLDSVSGRFDRLAQTMLRVCWNDDVMSCGQNDGRTVFEFVAEFAADAVQELDLAMRVPIRARCRGGFEVRMPASQPRPRCRSVR